MTDFPPGPNSIVPTAPAGDSSNRAASTAFVAAAVAAGSGGLIPTGTLMLFCQAAAPTGWTQVVTSNDVGLRLVSGTGGGTGGSTAFSTVFGQSATGAHTLTAAEMPSHAHTVSGSSGAAGTDGLVLAHTFPPGTALNDLNAVTLAAGSGGSHTHPISLLLSYVDVIQASKN